MQSICVFCGSSVGADPRFANAARCLGAALVNRNIRLVYGGGSVGLMGIVADEVLSRGGHVTGIIPQTLWDREVGHSNLSDLRIVQTMHERKAMMAKLSDGFIAMPGGIGTLEEFFEIWTWAQLGVHRKPCGMLNVCGYYDLLLAFVDHTVKQQFFREETRRMVLIETDVENLLTSMENYQAPAMPKWLDSAEV